MRDIAPTSVFSTPFASESTSDPSTSLTSTELGAVVRIPTPTDLCLDKPFLIDLAITRRNSAPQIGLFRQVAVGHRSIPVTRRSTPTTLRLSLSYHRFRDGDRVLGRSFGGGIPRCTELGMQTIDRWKAIAIICGPVEGSADRRKWRLTSAIPWPKISPRLLIGRLSDLFYVLAVNSKLSSGINDCQGHSGLRDRCRNDQIGFLRLFDPLRTLVQRGSLQLTFLHKMETSARGDWCYAVLDEGCRGFGGHSFAGLYIFQLSLWIRLGNRIFRDRC